MNHEHNESDFMSRVLGKYLLGGSFEQEDVMSAERADGCLDKELEIRSLQIPFLN